MTPSAATEDTSGKDGTPESQPDSPPQNSIKCFEDIINDFQEVTSASGTETNSPKNSEVEMKMSKQWSFIS